MHFHNDQQVLEWAKSDKPSFVKIDALGDYVRLQFGYDFLLERLIELPEAESLIELCNKFTGETIYADLQFVSLELQTITWPLTDEQIGVFVKIDGLEIGLNNYQFGQFVSDLEAAVDECKQILADNAAEVLDEMGCLDD